MQPGWEITSEWLECPACHRIIARSPDLGKTSTPCPECGAPGTRILFPSSPEADLIHMAAYFFQQGEKRRRVNEVHRLEDAAGEIGRYYESEHLREIAEELNRRFDASPDPLIDDQMYQDSIDHLMTHLNISSDQVLPVWHSLMSSTRETYEEHKATVLMACSAFESMFLNLLIHLGIWHGGIDPDAAEDTVENLRTTPQILNHFRMWAGCSYDDAIGQIGFSDFKREWDAIRDIRNTFMHGKGDDLTRSAAAKTVQLLSHMVAFFAALNNRFVRQIP